jgi:hypothetical protein
LPHGVNFQEAIFPDTQENRRMFSSLFQFANCSQGQQLVTFSSDWEIQEDNRVRIGWAMSCMNFVTNRVKENHNLPKPTPKIITLSPSRLLKKNTVHKFWIRGS